MKVVPLADPRNQVQKDLDEAVRTLQQAYGGTMSGFVVIAFGEDPDDPDSAYNIGPLSGKYFPDYVRRVVQERMDDDIEFETE